MAAEWEYTVVELPRVANKEREQKHGELINMVAAHGWRLLSVSGDPGQYGANTYAYFERRSVAPK